MPEGRVIKAYSGHYFVSYKDGVADCKLRGRLRKEDKDVLVGDMVLFTLTDAEGMYGVIEDVLPRKTRLLRPPVANVDQAVVVIACDEPSPDLELLDRILVSVEAESLGIVICINKIDLVESPDDLSEIKRQIEEVSRKPVFLISANNKTGLNGLISGLYDVLAAKKKDF